ncbi:MAG: hypothetical protein Q7T97_01800 [Burkholderiaceae bacterium]|nr:hypothetical protein [Burkholderiaceae bacterium]
MKRVLLVLMLAGAAGVASAEWVRAGASSQADVYADPSTIVRKENSVRMAALYDYKAADRATIFTKSLFSRVAQQEFDCDAARFRDVRASHYTQRMGTGDLLHTDSFPGSWQPVTPDSAAAQLRKIACGSN